MNSDLTIAIATYNGERYVRQAVASALATRPARVIVFDDCSTDGTAAILESFGSRIEFKRQERNVGIARQYQGLLDACETPLALLLNQDDLVIPRWFNTICAKPGEVTVLNGWVIDGSGERQRLIYRRPPYHALTKGVYRGLRIQNFARSPSQVILPVPEAKRVGGFEIPGDPGQGAEDWFCLLRLAAANVRFRLRLRPAMAYREHSGNYSHHSDSHQASKDAARANLPSAPSQNPRLRLGL
jgi:GT2 family glycosyltransferase